MYGTTGAREQFIRDMRTEQRKKLFFFDVVKFYFTPSKSLFSYLAIKLLGWDDRILLDTGKFVDSYDLELYFLYIR